MLTFAASIELSDFCNLPVFVEVWYSRLFPWNFTTVLWNCQGLPTVACCVEQNINTVVSVVYLGYSGAEIAWS